MNELVYEPKKIEYNGEELTVKRLGLKHVFTFIKILKKANILDYFQELVNGLRPEEVEGGELTGDEKEQGGKAIEIAISLIFTLVEADNEIYDLLGQLIGKKGKEVEELPLDVTIQIIEAIVTAPDLQAFSKAVSRLLPAPKAPTTAPMTAAMTE